MNHRDYFCKFKLNVEQYGEILGAQAFGLAKLGDAQPCYDLSGGKAAMIAALDAHSHKEHPIKADFFDKDESKVFIEVKSKLAYSNGSKASVVHCHPNKINGVERKKSGFARPMSHMLIVIVAPGPRGERNERNKTESKEGIIELAVLLTLADVKSLLGERKYINVGTLRKRITEYVDVTSVLNKVAQEPLHS